MLEDAILKLTEAVSANTAVLTKLAGGVPVPGATTSTETSTGETAAQKKARLKAEKDAADAAAAAAAGPTLQEFRDLATKIVDLNAGDKLAELAKKHGLERVSAAAGTEKAKEVFAELQKIHTAANV